MKTFIAATMLAATLTSAGWVDQQAQDTGSTISGTWRAQLSNSWTRRAGERWVSLQLQRDGDRNFGTSVPQAELEAAGIRGDSFSGSNLHFALVREAGRLDFEGSFDAGRGAGTFRFSPNTAFVSALQKGGRQISTDDALRLALHDVDQAFIASIEAAGYTGVSVQDLIKMRIHGVDAEYIAGFRKAGYDKLTIDDLVKTRIHGATPTYVAEMRNAGYTGLTIDDLVKTRIHGATPAFMQEVKAAGFERVPVDDLVKMRIHGVTPDFIRQVRALGYTKLSIDDLVKMRIHGVSPQFIRDVQSAGMKDMSAQDLVDLSIHGGRRWLRTK